jgi:hypothetical protein
MSDKIKDISWWVLRGFGDAILALIATMFLGVIRDMFALQTVNSIIGLVALGLFVLFTGYLVWVWKKQNSLTNPIFDHLSVYAIQKIDGNKVTSRPIFIENMDFRKAFQVRNIKQPYLRRERIKNWYNYDSKNKIINDLKKRDIQQIEENKDPTYDDLGLFRRKNGTIIPMRERIKPDALPKLNELYNGLKLNKFLIIYLNPRYCYFLRLHWFEALVYPPKNRIIVNTNTKQAYPAPLEYYDLAMIKSLIRHDRYTPRPKERIDEWCLRKKQWHYNDEAFTIERLIHEAGKLTIE